MRHIAGINCDIANSLRNIASVEQQCLLVDMTCRLRAYLQTNGRAFADPFSVNLPLGVLAAQRVEPTHDAGQIGEIAYDAIMHLSVGDRRSAFVFGSVEGG